MRKAIFIIVALFSMSVFSSCDEPEFTTSDSETVINNDTNHTDTDNLDKEETNNSMHNE